MITLKDIDPPVAEALTELMASLTVIGEGEEGQRIVDNILLDIEQSRKENPDIEEEETK